MPTIRDAAKLMEQDFGDSLVRIAALLADRGADPWEILTAIVDGLHNGGVSQARCGDVTQMLMSLMNLIEEDFG